MKTKTYEEKTLDALKAARKVLRNIASEEAQDAYKQLAEQITTVGYSIKRRKAEDAKYAELMHVGKCAAEVLREMVAALECDYDRLEELRLESKEFENKHGYKSANAALAELESAAGECTSRDDAEQRIQEDALSVEVCAGWYQIDEAGADSKMPVEFQILLSTGGPASRIMGELENGEPCDARLEVQDWGTSWTHYREEGLSDVLLTYSRCFYFGE